MFNDYKKLLYIVKKSKYCHSFIHRTISGCKYGELKC